MKLQPSHYLKYLALLLLLGAVAFFFFGYKSFTDSNEKTSESFKPFKQWYQINWHKQAIGWASVELEKNDSAYIVTEQDAIEGRVNGERLRFEFLRKLYFQTQAPYLLVKGEIESREPQLVVIKSFSNDIKAMSLNEIRNGKRSQKKQKPIEYTLSDYLSLRKFIAAQPKAKALHIHKELNNDDLGLHYSRYEILATPSKTKNSFKLRHQLQNSNKIQADYLSEASIVEVKPTGIIQSITKPNGMRFIASKLKVSLNPEMQKDLYLNSGIPVDKPLGDPKTIKSLSLSLAKGTWGLMDIHPSNLQSNLLTLTSGATLKPKRAVIPAKPQVDPSPALSKLYKTLPLKGLSSEQKVSKLVNFVNTHLDYQVLPANFNLDDILTNKIGDCSEHALLLSELLRHAAIPARQISGLVYLGDEEQRFGGHVWVEAYYDGAWHPVDPTWNLTQTTATHIPLVIGAYKSPKALLNAGRLELKLEQLKR